MKNKCINCKWFASCKKASDKIEDCEWFEPHSYADKIIEEIEKELRF